MSNNNQIWYYADGKSKMGPYSKEVMEEFLANGRIHKDTLVWCPDYPNWIPASQSSLKTLEDKMTPPDIPVIPVPPTIPNANPQSSTPAYSSMESCVSDSSTVSSQSQTDYSSFYTDSKKFSDKRNIQNVKPKKKGHGCLTAIVIFGVVIILLSLCGRNDSEQETHNETTTSAETTKAETTAESTTAVPETEESTEAVDVTPYLQAGIEEFSTGQYSYVTAEDLDKYGSNMNGARIYIVGTVGEVKPDQIQIDLGVKGFMFSNFAASTDYTPAIKQDDTVAILGTVSGYTHYFTGNSVSVENSFIFAVGSDAEQYRKDKTDEALSSYLVVTEDVANANKGDISESDYKALCKKLKYNDIMRNPDQYKKQYCKVSGRVEQIIEGFFNTYTIYITDANGNKWECSYMYKDGESHLLEGDKVTVYGTCSGTTTATTVLGKQVTLPSVQLEYIH